jgi:hypothetical protein
MADIAKVSKCMCEECRYNDNYECHANGIEVRSSGTNRVESSEGTCCDTFISKNDNYSSI